MGDQHVMLHGKISVNIYLIGIENYFIKQCNEENVNFLITNLLHYEGIKSFLGITITYLFFLC